jgi:hypothetical protein|tara:strand:- start:71 stop:601 length:531 start_codon:yes stop_codon:yes gene_type:complete
METPQHIYRSKVVLGIFIGGFGLFILLWFLTFFGILEIEGFTSGIFTLFIFGFITPAFGYFVWLSRKKEPVLSIFDNRIVLRHLASPSKTIEINTNQIQEVRTNWEGFNSESWCDIIFKVTEEAFVDLSRKGFWRKAEANELYFEFSSAELNCFKTVDLITRHLKNKQADQVVVRQ